MTWPPALSRSEKAEKTSQHTIPTHISAPERYTMRTQGEIFSGRGQKNLGRADDT